MNEATGVAKPAAVSQFWDGTALMLALLPLSVAAWMFDDRLLGGVSVWQKPIKFEASLALHFATLAVIAARLSPRFRDGAAIKALVWLGLIALVAEIGYILIQAARQQPSHFNVSTPFHAFMYFAIMGGGALILVGIAGALGAVAAIDRDAAFGPATRVGVVVGLLGGMILTLIVAGRMSSALDHSVGSLLGEQRLMPLTGWSMRTGDLRAPHFFATHAMQAIPLAGLLLDRLPSARAAVPALWLFAVTWVAITIASFVQALSGRPLLPG